MALNPRNPRTDCLKRLFVIFVFVAISTDVRYGRGLMLDLEGKVKKKSAHRYEANGYDVTCERGHWQCGCPDH